jgi:hypothetical protein
MSNRYDPEVIRTRYGPILRLFTTGQMRDGFWLDPSRLTVSATTFMARLRDAVAAIRDGKVAVAGIDSTQLVAEWSKYRMETKGEMVVFVLRKRAAVEQPVPVDAPASITIPPDGLVISSAAVLLSGRYIKGPIKIEGVLTAKQKAFYEGNYDIAFDSHETFTLMV